MKAGYLARYVLTPFSLEPVPKPSARIPPITTRILTDPCPIPHTGTGAPRSRWAWRRTGTKREADVWIRRAPPGGDDALVRLMRRAANAGAMGEAQTVGPTAIEFFNGKEYPPRGTETASGKAEARMDWRITNGGDRATLADAVDVEIAMRVMSAARVEESVLVALADRRRALETRAVPPG